MVYYVIMIKVRLLCVHLSVKAQMIAPKQGVM